MGLDVLPGFVLDRYDSSSGTRFVVRLDPQGSGTETLTVTVPESDVYSSEDAEAIGPPGSWVAHGIYERQVHNALGRILRRLKVGLVRKNEQLGDHGYDYIVEIPDGMLIIEVDYVPRKDWDMRRAMSIMSQLEYPVGARKVLVSNGNYPDSIARRLTESGVVPVTWRDPQDDEKLDRTIRLAVEPAQ